MRGGLQAIEEKNLQIIFVGREEAIREELPPPVTREVSTGRFRSLTPPR